jgi:aryl-alcohol dehydrogenase-like predicted oxidoreductase
MPTKPTDYRLFGRTGVKISPLTLGTMTFGKGADQEESARIVDRALDAGINSIDTSNSYGRGVSERFTGEALKRNGKRDRVFLASKFNFAMTEDDPNNQGVSRRHIISQVEESLRRLQTDHLDLYQIHRPHPEVAIDETLRALDDLVRSGKVRYIGSTTFAAWQVVEALWASDRLHLHRFVSEQPPYSLLDRRVERELLPVARTFGLGIIPWSPLGGGLLTGKYRRDQPPPEGTRYAQGGPIQAKRFTREAFDAIEPLQALADKKGVPLSRFALAWVVHQPGVTSPIIGPRTLDQLEDALAALEIDITEDDRRQIDQIVPPGTHAAPFYEASHGPSQHRW